MFDKEVSIVIVCMNNLKNLYPCLDSIKNYTTINYEVFVVAYLFTPENLTKVKTDYPWVDFIESNEIRGFSENNNLALRQVRGKYCLVLNDDTEMKMPVIDRLVADMENLPDKVACISPKTVFGDGELQSCGRPFMNWKTFILGMLYLWKEKNDTKWINKKGLFRSYNLVGAAFLIKTELFRNIGWFDEYFFFCPEDIKVGTVLNEQGYECWVDSDVTLCHYEGRSSRTRCNKMQLATFPAGVKGAIHFYSNGCFYRKIILTIVSFLVVFMKFCVFSITGLFKSKPNNDEYKAKAMWNTIKYAYGNKTPKQIFTAIYTNLY